MINEIWKDILKYEGIYQISDLGRVKSLKQNKETILKLQVNGKGYSSVSLSKDGIVSTKLVHKLVWFAFNGETDLYVLHNIEGNKLDCRLSNLHIGTQRENRNEYLQSIEKSSKYVGVCWCNHFKKWKSTIRINGTRKNIGYFKNEIDAANAYQEKLKLTK